MLRAIIISPNRELSGELHRAAAQFNTVTVIRVVDHYPSIVELTRIVRAHAPQVVLIATESVSSVTAAAVHLEQVSPGVQIIAAGRNCGSDTS